MIAASGVIGLLLMGAAVSGLMAGAESADTSGDDDDDGTGQPPGAADEPGEPGVGTTWTGDFAEDGSLKAAGPASAADTPLAQLLFPDATTPPDPEEDADVFAHLDENAGTTPDADTTAPDDHADMLDVIETIPFPGGPDIPRVMDFDCATDRLILDFDGTEAEAPEITVDLETRPGHALVEANGVAVTLVDGAPGLTPEHVDIAMSGNPSDAPTATDDATVPSEQPGHSGSDGTTRVEGDIGTVQDFDREADQIEILYDSTALDDPRVEVTDFSDGTGASILLNGEPVLHVVGAQGLDPGDVVLRPSDSLPAPSPEGTQT